METRILIRTESGIKGFSYKWNQDQTDAFYQAGASKENLVIHENGTDHNFSYYFPSSNDCHRCHTDSKSVILGFTTSQLNKDVVHNGHSVNQLELFSKSEWLDASDFGGTYSNLPKYVDYRDQNASLDQRARGFMDVQCATCHNLQTNTGNAKLNLNYSTSLAQTGLCNKVPHAGDAGMPNRKLLEPGHPETSILMARLNSNDPALRMPAVATSRIDIDASRMMNDWIKSLQDCR
ncbi:MAG: hypothetical protein NT027_01400 [Proteobacteria bacterium]|nr:hypothetical protein [Pseudomonadota bacterium]